MSDADQWHRPAGVFFQVWLRWHWLPFVTDTVLGVVLTWGPFAVGYIRGETLVEVRKDNPDADA